MEPIFSAELAPEERLLAALIRLAIRDAQQPHNERLRDEARRWLWWVAPDIARRAGVTQVNVAQQMLVQNG